MMLSKGGMSSVYVRHKRKGKYTCHALFQVQKHLILHSQPASWKQNISVFDVLTQSYLV